MAIVLVGAIEGNCHRDQAGARSGAGSGARGGGGGRAGSGARGGGGGGGGSGARGRGRARARGRSSIDLVWPPTRREIPLGQSEPRVQPQLERSPPVRCSPLSRPRARRERDRPHRRPSSSVHQSRLEPTAPANATINVRHIRRRPRARRGARCHSHRLHRHQSWLGHRAAHVVPAAELPLSLEHVLPRM